MKRISKTMLAAAATACLAIAAFASAETPDELFDRLDKKVKEVKSSEMTIEMKMDSPYMKMTMTSKNWMEQDGEKVKIRTESETKQSMGGTDTASKSLIVSDGTSTWTENEMAGQKTVMKSKAMDKNQSTDFSALREMVKQSNGTVKEPQEVDGKKCSVLEMKMGEGEMGQTMTYWFAEDTGMMVKMVGEGKMTGTTTTTIKDIKVNADVDDAKFKYEPPAGVEVQEM